MRKNAAPQAAAEGLVFTGEPCPQERRSAT